MITNKQVAVIGGGTAGMTLVETRAKTAWFIGLDGIEVYLSRYLCSYIVR